MKSNLRRWLLFVVLFSGACFANQAYVGYCSNGGTKVVTSGLNSTTSVMASYPGCTVTVNNLGGGLATIFSDNLGTPLSNPFQASLITGQFIFYANNARYSITLSGGTPLSFPLPVTITDVLLNDPASPLGCLSIPALTGDVTSAGGTCATVLPNIAAAGTGLKTTINAKGQVTGVTTAASTDLSDTAIIARLNATANFGANPVTTGALVSTTGTFSGSISGTGATFTSEVAPSVTGVQLGDTAHRWDLFARNIDWSGTFSGGLLSPSSLAVTNNATIGGSLTVTGASTLSSVSLTGNVAGGVGTAAGGSLNMQKASTPSAIFMGRMVDSFGNTNNQLIGFNIEQMINPSLSVGYSNIGQTIEWFTPTTNSQTFTAGQSAVDFAFVHAGSGNFTGSGSGSAATLEAFNSGAATMALLVGATGTSTNGPVSVGVPVQSPTGGGNITDARGLVGQVKNQTTGTITTAESILAESIPNTGGGTITTAIGLQVNDQTTGGTNYAIKTGLGQVSFGDAMVTNSPVTLGASAGSGIDLTVFPSNLTGTTQQGIRSLPVCSSATTVLCIGVRSEARTAAAAFTVPRASAFLAGSPSIGAGSAITKYAGFDCESSGILSGATSNYCVDHGQNAERFLERAAPSGAASSSILYDDSTTHVFMLSNANDAFSPIARNSDIAGGTLAGKFTTIGTANNCSSSASPAVCGSAAAGSVVIAAGATTVTVDTTVVTNNSQIIVFEDESLGTRLGVTCNTTLNGGHAITARTAATSFVITTNVAPVANPRCLSYLIVN